MMRQPRCKRCLKSVIFRIPLNYKGLLPTGHLIDHLNVLCCTLLKACVYFYIFKMHSKTHMG